MQRMTPIWMWLLAALALLIIEAKTATLNFLFLAGAAALTAGAVWLGLDSGWPSFLVFGVLSLLGILTLRKRILAAMGKAEPVSIDVNHTVTAQSALTPGAEGSIEYQGSVFTAINTGPLAIAPGDRMRIVKTEGIKLLVEKA